MSSFSITPTSTDILLGRGGNTFKHKGNDRLRKMAEDIVIDYHHASKAKKSTMIDDMTNDLLQEGIRFLCRGRGSLGEPAYWEELDKDKSRKKVSQEIREAVKKWKKKAQEKVSKNRPPSGQPIRRNRSDTYILHYQRGSPQSRSRVNPFGEKRNNIVSRMSERNETPREEQLEPWSQSEPYIASIRCSRSHMGSSSKRITSRIVPRDEDKTSSRRLRENQDLKELFDEWKNE